MAKDVFHIVPHGDEWAVKKEGNERNNSTHGTQKEAIESAQDMAQDGDAIVIHRADGTIRGRFSYSEENEKNGRSNDNGNRKDRDREEITISDIASVGSRVSWPAVLAGTVVALAVYVTLMALATAIGITAREQVADAPQRSVIIAALFAVVSLLAALFLGGMVASWTTAGETKSESIIYGVLVWGTLFALMTFTGANMAGNAAIATGLFANANEGAQNNWNLTDEQLQKTGLNEEQQQGLRKEFNLDRALNSLNLNEEQKQRVHSALAEGRDVDPAVPAWIGFGAMLLSIFAAIAGAVVAAGPELVLREFRTRRGMPLGSRVGIAPAGAVRSQEKVRA